MIERTASLDHWRETSDRRAPLPALQAYDEELCWLSGLEDKDPAFEEYEGFMGNYGNTLEREYRRAAVVLWSARDRYRILARAGGEQGGATALRLPSFAAFCRRVNALNDDAWHGITESLFDTLHALAIEDHAKHHATVSMRTRRQNVVRECTQLEALLDAAREIHKRKIKQLIVALTRELDHYASEVPIVVLENLAKDAAVGKPDKALEAHVMQTRKLVNERAVKAFRAKGDWRIDVATSCKCTDCRTLTQFLRSRERAIDLPLAKDRRRHLHDRISELEISVSHSTRRQGRPFVLELRKINTLFKEAALEQTRESALADRDVLKL